MATFLLPADKGAGAAAAACSTFGSTDRGSSFIYGSLDSKSQLLVVDLPAGGFLASKACTVSAAAPLLPAPPPPCTPPLPCTAASPPAPRRSSLQLAAAGPASLPSELLGAILELVLADDAAHDRRPVVQHVGRAWLAAYRCAAYRRVSLHVGAALRCLTTRRGLNDKAAADALLAGLAARLPHAAEVRLTCVPPALAPGAAPTATKADQCGAASEQQPLRWRLGALLRSSLGGSTRLRRLNVDYLPQLPELLEAQLAAPAQQHSAGLACRLESLGVGVLPAAETLRQLPLLTRLPLRALAVADAACLGEEEGGELAAALGSLTRLTFLSLGGSPATAAASAADAAHLPVPVQPGALPAQPSTTGVCLPGLALVAAAAGLPGLKRLELSLTFSKQQCAAQQAYLQHLGTLLHRQRAANAAAVSAAGGAAAQGNRVSVTVHEHVQGDLSAVPVASCSLNLDWDDDSNPIEVWQCSTLRRLRIAAQLPLQAGQFRPARLAALRVLEVAGCCYIPAYFAEALVSMQQLHRLVVSDCQLEAVASVPWQRVLPALPALCEVTVERCAGAVLLSTLWAGLAACPHLRFLRVTGRAAGGALPPPAILDPSAGADVTGGWEAQVLHPFALDSPFFAPACAIPDCVALMQSLRRLDLSHNALHSLPAGLAWCRSLRALTLRGNRLGRVPPGVAALRGLRKLDLSNNQLSDLEEGPYLLQLEELLLGGNLGLVPARLPASLLHRARLRRLSIPSWWRPAGAEGMAGALLHLMPWLALEES